MSALIVPAHHCCCKLHLIVRDHEFDGEKELWLRNDLKVMAYDHSSSIPRAPLRYMGLPAVVIRLLGRVVQHSDRGLPELWR
jgi:hypothetical protein